MKTYFMLMVLCLIFVQLFLQIQASYINDLFDFIRFSIKSCEDSNLPKRQPKLFKNIPKKIWIHSAAGGRGNHLGQNGPNFGIIIKMLSKRTDELIDVHVSEQLLEWHGFSSTNPIAIIVPGFHDSGYNTWSTQLANKFQSTGSNVFIIDWAAGAGGSFLTAKENTRLVAREITRFINHLGDEYNITSDRIHCYGHDLGSLACAPESNYI